MEIRRVCIIASLIIVFFIPLGCYYLSSYVHGNDDYEISNGSKQSENFYRNYHRVDEIHRYIDAIAEKGSSMASVFSIGTSVEGRLLKVITISSNLTQPKPSIFIEGGIHAREWISPATATYIADMLVNEYSKNKDLVDGFHWYILPVLNPDGYEFSHENAGNRLWRKNRNPKNEICLGVDLNRNWAFHWNESGSSQDVCSKLYSGPAPFSEPETRALADFILAEKNRMKFVAYLAIHSYGQLWLIPWGWTKEKSPDYADMEEVAEVAVEALAKVNGTEYAIQSSSKDTVGSGAADDWAKGFANIKYTYTIELPDKGQYGFELPAQRIEMVTKETWEAIKALVRSIKEKER